MAQAGTPPVSVRWPAPAGPPAHVVAMIATTLSTEFATLTRAGVPINTPTYSFPADDMTSIDLATGLGYPAKAERLRRDARTGLWIDGILPGEPTISIAGRGAVCDADIQANSLRYIAEVGLYSTPGEPEWDVRHKAVWYWARILMRIVPCEILWWDSADDLGLPPHRWRAPDGTDFPLSDAAPPGPATRAPLQDQPHWSVLARQALARGVAGHVSLVDEGGYPRPARALRIEQVEDGFLLDIPPHAPGYRHGAASLSFRGVENFVGTASPAGSSVHMVVDRALPILPLVADPQEIWNPAAGTRAALMGRLQAELERRGQPMPAIPAMPPEPTRFARLRAERLDRLMGQGRLTSGSGTGRTGVVEDNQDG